LHGNDYGPRRPPGKPFLARRCGFEIPNAAVSDRIRPRPFLFGKRRRGWDIVQEKLMALADKVKEAGVVVNNVETFVNLPAAGRQVISVADGLANAVAISRPHADTYREVV
jgi:hypothetical protein